MLQVKIISPNYLALQPRTAYDFRMVNNEVQFYEDNSFQSIAHKIHMAKVANYSMAQGSSKNLHVVTYVPGAKGAPSFTKMYQYPNFADTQVW